MSRLKALAEALHEAGWSVEEFQAAYLGVSRTMSANGWVLPKEDKKDKPPKEIEE